MRGVIGLIAVLVVGTAVLVGLPAISVAQGQGCASTVGCAGAPSSGSNAAPVTGAEPPGSDDPYRTHVDPGAWPLLVLILALFALMLIVRGSRPKRHSAPGPEDRRHH